MQSHLFLPRSGRHAQFHEHLRDAISRLHVWHSKTTPEAPLYHQSLCQQSKTVCLEIFYPLTAHTVSSFWFCGRGAGLRCWENEFPGSKI